MSPKRAARRERFKKIGEAISAQADRGYNGRSNSISTVLGCPQITNQINLAFATDINKDVVRRILAAHYRPVPGADGPSWLTFLGQTKDSLWSLDLFRCESMMLRNAVYDRPYLLDSRKNGRS